MPLEHSRVPVASDPVAASVEGHLRSMEEAGHGEFSIECEKGEVVLSFGGIQARGENYDVALLRLASALLDSVDFSSLF